VVSPTWCTTRQPAWVPRAFKGVAALTQAVRSHCHPSSVSTAAFLRATDRCTPSSHHCSCRFSLCVGRRAQSEPSTTAPTLFRRRPAGKHHHAGSSPKPTVVPHSLPPPCHVLCVVLLHLTLPLPMCRLPHRARAERRRHTPSAAAPLVVYDLPVPSTLPRVGSTPRRATYFSNAVGRAAPPPRDAAPSCRAGARAMRSGCLAR
jgi:hypothetical protein